MYSSPSVCIDNPVPLLTLDYLLLGEVVAIPFEVNHYLGASLDPLSLPDLIGTKSGEGTDV